jgi:branched-chain amino acid aminotransferase
MSSGRVVWLNGELVPEAEAKVSIYDSALMFGDMVFEMTRSFAGVQFRLRDHLDRLYASMRYVRIPEPMPIDELEAVCLQTVEANAPVFAVDDEHRLMINVSRGPLSIYAGVFGGHPGPTVAVADFPLKWTVAAMGHLFDRGINAVITAQRAIPAQLLDPKVKSRSRLHYMMANIQAAAVAGEDNWALLLDPDGFVAEGTGDNFFIVRDGVVQTPEPRNVLRGVSRQYVFELADELGLPWEERNLDPFDVLEADEAFMTGTPFCMLPVTTLDGQAIGDGAVGPVFRRLLGRWSENVGVDIAQQIRDWSAEADRSGLGAGTTPYQFTRAR